MQGVIAALAALHSMQDKTQQVYVQRPGGVVLGLSHSQALQALKDGMHADCFASAKRRSPSTIDLTSEVAPSADLELCKDRQQQLQQKQKALTEILGDQGDLGQSLLDAVL